MIASFRATFQGLPRTFWYVWFGTLLNRLGSFVTPFLALYLTEERKLSTAEAGVIVSLFGLGSLLASLVGGLLADRVGRKATLMMGLVPASFAMLGLGLSSAPATIAVMTFLTGFTSELFRPAVSALVADIVPPEDRLRAYATLYWASNIAFSVSPIIAGVMAGYSYLALFVADAVTTLAYAAVVWLRIPETRPAEVEEAALHDDAGFLRRVWQRIGFAEVARDGVFLTFVALSLALGVVFFQFNSTLPLEIRSHGLSPAAFGGIIAVNGVMIVVLQPYVVRQVHRFRRSHVLAMAALLVGVGFGVNTWADSIPFYVVGVMIWTLGELVNAPVAAALVADLSPVWARGRYQAVFSMSFGSAYFLGPAIGSAVMQQFGATTLWLGCFAAGVMIAAGHLLVAAPRRRRMRVLKAQGLTAATNAPE